MSINEKLRNAGIIPDDMNTLKTRDEIQTMRNEVGAALAYLTVYDSDLADKLAALPPEENEE